MVVEIVRVCMCVSEKKNRERKRERERERERESVSCGLNGGTTFFCFLISLAEWILPAVSFWMHCDMQWVRDIDCQGSEQTEKQQQNTIMECCSQNSSQMT